MAKQSGPESGISAAQFAPDSPHFVICASLQQTLLRETDTADADAKL